MARQRRAGGGVDRLPSGRYRVRIVSPEGERLSIGSFTTRRAAETAYARSLADRADGKWRAPVEATITLEEYAASWIEERLTNRGEPLRPRVKDMYRSQLRFHILPALGSTPCSKITTAKVRSWSAEKRGPDGPGSSTAAKCYRLLRSIMTTATEDGLLAANPCNIKGAGVEPAEERPIPTVAQVHALAETIGRRYRCIVLLAGFVGLRKGELLGLRRCDLDLEVGELSVVQQRQLDRHGQHLVGPPKSAAGKRTIALPASLIPDLQHHLDEYAEPGRYGYVFTGQQGNPLAPHVLHGAWSRARAAHDLDHIHLHDLRHLAGTLAASTGAGTKELMYRHGHASPQAALRYQHATRDRDSKLASAIDAVIGCHWTS